VYDLLKNELEEANDLLGTAEADATEFGAK
jgi:hypothetical protein